MFRLISRLAKKARNCNRSVALAAGLIAVGSAMAHADATPPTITTPIDIPSYVTATVTTFGTGFAAIVTFAIGVGIAVMLVKKLRRPGKI